MTARVFIDGEAGTTGLGIRERLAHVPGVAVVSHSGGVSSLTADMCGLAGLDLPPLSDHARDGIAGILKGFGWSANPADVTGFANSASFPSIMDYLIDEPQVGTLVIASAGAVTFDGLFVGLWPDVYGHEGANLANVAALILFGLAAILVSDQIVPENSLPRRKGNHS